MKQISLPKIHLGKLLLAGFLLISLLSFGSPSVLAADVCSTTAGTDNQAAAQAACVKKYVDECKKTYDVGFCESLSVRDINKCAAASGVKFKDACMKELQSVAKQKDSGSSATLDDPTVSDDCDQPNVESLNEKNCGIIGYIVTITNFLSALVGVVIVAMIILGGIQYSMAGADPSKVQAAKQKIFNALLALVLFIFGFALVQWLIPGGLF
jgi:hypothetical protein